MLSAADVEEWVLQKLTFVAHVELLLLVKCAKAKYRRYYNTTMNILKSQQFRNFK